MASELYFKSDPNIKEYYCRLDIVVGDYYVFLGFPRVYVKKQRNIFCQEFG